MLYNYYYSNNKKPFSPTKNLGLDFWYRSDRNVKTTGARQFTEANSEYFDAPGDDFALGDSDFTNAFWVYTDSVATANKHVMDMFGGAAPYAYQTLINTAGQVRFTIYGPSQATTVITSANGAIVDDAWRFVAVRYNATTDLLDMRVTTTDSTAVSHADGMDPTVSGKEFSIGASNSGGNTVDGRMDSVGAWSRRLSDAEVTTLYNSGGGLAYKNLSTAMKVSLISWYDLDELSGNALDAHGSNNLTDKNTVTAATGIAASDPDNNDPVATYDPIFISANTGQFAQPTFAKRGTFSTTAVGGKQAVVGDGSDDIYTTTDDISNASAGTLFIVFNPVTTTGTFYILSKNDTGTDDEFFGIRAINGVVAVLQQNTLGTLNMVSGTTTTLVTSGNYIITIQSTGTAWSLIHVNGINQSLSVVSGSNNGNWFSDVASFNNWSILGQAVDSELGHWNARLAEVYHTTEVLGAAQIRKNEAYLAQRYGVSLP